jgi:hypothetical protein
MNIVFLRFGTGSGRIPFILLDLIRGPEPADPGPDPDPRLNPIFMT